MSRISKWKLEKTKVKVVFRLQFHATHIPQTGWDKLFISLIPADTGKPTAKTTKTNVRNGGCKWGDPIYETTRLLQDSRTKLYDEKLYKLVVAMGSSRSSVLGEAIINLADYVDASKPIITTFPLQGCNFGTILHITVQLLTSKTGFREFEQQRELREKGLQSSEGLANDQADKVRTKFKADANELSSLEEEAIDGSSNTSGSLYAEKHEVSSTNELDSIKYELSHIQSPQASKEEISNHQNIVHGITESIHEWSSNNSIENELTTENNRLRGSLEFAESSLFNLKLEVSSLQGVADELGSETQKLSDEFTAEISSAQELAREILFMKSECLKFKDDIMNLKESELSSRIPLMEARNVHLQFSNGISVVEDKIRELQKKTYAASLEGDTKFIHLELEALLNFLHDFKLGNGEKVPSESADLRIRELSRFESGNGFGLDLCPPESVLSHFGSNPPVSDAINPMDAMKAQIFDLVRELDEAKVEKESLTQKMYQMECYYEALIHELEENQKRLVGELQLLRNEHTTCLYALTVSKTEVESLREEMNQQMLLSAEERRDLEAINEELGRRATASEAALRRARLNYSIAVDKLQKDLELLSLQVSSMFEANESLIKKALVKNLEEDDAIKSTQFQNQKLGLKKRSGGGDVLLEELKRSVSMQEDLYRKVEEELVEMHSINFNLDIYSKALEMSLCEVMKSSTATQNQLMLQLQKATEEIHALDEFKSRSISQCGEMALQNQLLEEKLMSLSKENYLLSEKLIDWESTLSELRSCESKYAACLAANAELSLQLNHEAFENEKLRAESGELVSSKRNLEESIEFMQEKLTNLLVAYGSQSLNLDLKDAVMQLEQLQHDVSTENLRLMEEKLNLEMEKDSADVALSSVRSEILLMKEKFKSGIQDMVTKLDVSDALVERLQVGIESVANKIHLSSEIEDKHVEKNEVLLADLALFEDQMQNLISRNGGLDREISNLDSLAEELGRSKLEITELIREKQELDVRLMEKSEESLKLSCKVKSLTEGLKTLHDELHDGKALKEELESRVQDLTLSSSKDQEKLLELELEKAELERKVQDLTLSLSKDQEKCLEIEQQKAELEEKVQHLTSCLSKDQQEKSELQQRVQDLTLGLSKDQGKWLEIEQHKSELERKVQDLTHSLSKDQEKQLEVEQQKALLERKVEDLTLCLSKDQAKLVEFEQQKADLELKFEDRSLSWSKDQEKLVEFEHQRAELERKVEDLILCLSKDEAKLVEFEQQKAELERKVEDLSLCLSEDQEKLVEFEQQKAELERRVEDLTLCLSKDQEKQLEFELEKAELERKIQGLALCSSEDKQKQLELEQRASHLELEKSRLAHLLHQQNELVEELKKNSSSQALFDSQLSDMHEYALASDVKLIHISNQYETLLQALASSEMDLQKKYHSTESMLNRSLEGEANWRREKEHLLANLESLQSELQASVAQNKLLSESNNEMKVGLEASKRELSTMEEETSHLILSKEELDVLVIVLKGKVDEQTSHIALLEGFKEELLKLQSQYNELSHKFSEQVRKTEEFKNLSVHLKELKDRAESECEANRERRENEVASVTRQDSLRVAFIKEQYETKNQELKQQLSMSKKHGEEMLMKLQDAIDEIESRKKSEAMSLKKNEELSTRLSALEAELLSVISERREKSNAYDRTKAELECAQLSLECCKEEKETLRACLLEFEAEKSNLVDELTSMKAQLQDLKCLKDLEKSESFVSVLDRQNTGGEGADSTEPVQDAASNVQSNRKASDVKNENSGARKLRSSIEHLHEELEKMKNENTIFDMGDDVNPDCQDTGKEIMRLRKANEELRSMFPLFDEISSGGNALDRVLALEIELAEALKTKNKSNTLFQSSFLKQHSDEEAIFKSFRDINELIKEMLELKGRHAGVEAELREMHDRYSRLSLQFAEVEGERQKLKITLRNARSINRRFSSDNVMDHNQPL